jgi:hypothetical protein
MLQSLGELEAAAVVVRMQTMKRRGGRRVDIIIIEKREEEKTEQRTTAVVCQIETHTYTTEESDGKGEREEREGKRSCVV